MAKFVAAEIVERIEWDFTGVPHVGAQDDDREPKTVSGPHVTGVLVEPSPDTVARFMDAHEQIAATALKAKDSAVARLSIASAGGRIDEDDERDAVIQRAADAITSGVAYEELHQQAIAALRIVDVPAELLEQLPPRHIAAFLSYVAGELQGEGGAA